MSYKLNVSEKQPQKRNAKTRIVAIINIFQKKYFGCIVFQFHSAIQIRVVFTFDSYFYTEKSEPQL